jgi:EAL domain-containing protein (putative c-di-GMP-specific phosphodiesterase class I)
MRRSPPAARPPRLQELRFQFQPIAPLTRRETGWSEALVRWNLPDGTVHGPLDVLPHWLAPARLEAFTEHTLRSAAAAIAATQGAVVSVNMSPSQVMHPATLTQLERLLPEIRARIRIELTEDRVHDPGGLRDAITVLRERCQILLLDDVTPDDLGHRTYDGGSVDGVKLDRAVVALLFDDGRRSEVTRFVRDVTERFPIVVAEGIEEPTMVDALAALGVSHAQGFGIARPAPFLAAEVPPMIAEPQPGAVDEHGSHGERTGHDAPLA